MVSDFVYSLIGISLVGGVGYGGYRLYQWKYAIPSTIVDTSAAGKKKLVTPEQEKFYQKSYNTYLETVGPQGNPYFSYDDFISVYQH